VRGQYAGRVSPGDEFYAIAGAGTRRVWSGSRNLAAAGCGSAWTAQVLIHCDFSRARLEKVDFQSTSFVRCRFAGDLVEVIFYDHGFKTGKPDPNQMEDVDFAGAVLHDVEFRRLNLDKVTFPVAAGHLVVRCYRCVIERALAELAEERTREARLLKVTLEHQLRWAGPDQQVGMFSLLDLEDSGGPELAERAANLLRHCEEACGANGSRSPNG
jgi:Pentapeptide repeats (9 copies)